LIANLHAHLDDQKSPWSLLEARSDYYQEMIHAVLSSFGVDTGKLQFVRGSDFQTTKDYVLDVLRMSALTTLNRTKRAASEVVRFGKEPKMGGFFYPLMQIADCQAMEIDVTLGGIDQRGIYMLGRELLPQLGHEKSSCVFTPLLPGLTGSKMSASDPKSKIDLLDSKKDVEKKVNSAYCKEGEVKDNGVLAFCEYFIFPFKGKLKVERSEKFGGNVGYKGYKELERDFVKKKLHPMDLKQSVAKEINGVLEPIRKRFEKEKKLMREAYP
jgi:tyrosyl-tRNA synthetase